MHAASDIDRPDLLPWTEPVVRGSLTTLQVNLGSYCNLACTHCHVEAGPRRTEVMPPDVRGRVIDWIRRHRPPVVDLTGGAPELIQGFRELVVAAREAGSAVIDRSNLVVLQEPGQEDLADFLAAQRVTVVGSLPCYLAGNVDRQRGRGTYDGSIKGLQRLNAVGYGRSADLPLYLVYNPGGASLPPRQDELEPAYRTRLKADWDIDFTALWCLANVPITRFRRSLQATGQLDPYLDLLRRSYNPETVAGLMCRTTLSVAYDGRLFDCDFNQALGLPLADRHIRHLWDVDPSELERAPIAMRAHCLACTAGCGSSCTGAVAG
ncbi:MAG: arsenosugar biosynthesis radical SAM protein ArsS [Planctomycetes bacterium]|nr:arsenosugar biosynthesis radical SAM protein ArsS [Planctomycetota bacterium]